MKISKIELENVKCFSNETLSLLKEGTEEPLSMCALVGANGVGKSTILKSIVAAFSTLESEYQGESFTDDAVSYDKDYLKVNLDLKLNENEKNILNFQGDKLEMRYRHFGNEYEDMKDVLVIPEDLSDGETEQYANVITDLFWNE